MSQTGPGVREQDVRREGAGGQDSPGSLVALVSATAPGPRDRDRPLERDGESSVPGDPVYPSRDRQSRVTVVVCDQFPVFARGLAKLLEEEAPNLRVTGVEVDLSRVKDAISELSPAVALIGLSGDGAQELDVVRDICSAFPGTRVILLLPDTETMTACHTVAGAGVAGYELKERDSPEIAEVVNLVARGHVVAPAAVGFPGAKRSDPRSLDDVEREILKGIARSETNRQLAARLHLSQRTICRRLDGIYAKLHLADRLQAAVYASVHGLVGDGACPDRQPR